MPDQPTPDIPGLFQSARLVSSLGIAGLVIYARSLDEGIERDRVRQAIQETSNALKRIYPKATAEAAHAYALRTLELRPADEEPTPISGDSLERYAEEVTKHLFAYGEDA